jgi:uncharacterized protein DUF2568
MRTSDSVLNLVVAVLELATLFAVCVWGFEQNVFAGIAAPAVVGMVWHRWITSRLPRPVAQ